MEITEADLGEEAEALGDFGEDVSGDGGVATGKFDGLDEGGGVGDGELGDGVDGDGFARCGERELGGFAAGFRGDRDGHATWEEDGAGDFVEAGAFAVGAGDELVIVGAVEFAVVIEFGFGLGVESIGFVFGLSFGCGDLAVAAAGFAPAAGGVEGEVRGVEGFEGAAGDGADAGGGEDVDLILVIEDAEGAFADADGVGDGVAERLEATAGFLEVADFDVHVVLLESLEALEAFDVFPLHVDEEAGVAVAAGPIGDFGVEAFAAADDGGEDGDGAFGEVLADCFGDGLLGLRDDGDAGLRAVLDAEFGEEEAEEVVDLGDRGDGGLAPAAGDALFDGDSGRETADAVDVGLFHLLGELPGVGGHGVEEAALAFGEDDVEG